MLLQVKKKRRSFNKKGISIIVGYVLLISFAVIVGVVVYRWMRTYVPTDVLECDSGVSLFLKDYYYDCDDESLTLTLRNNGRFNLAGYFIYARDNPNDELATIDLSEYSEEGSGGIVSFGTGFSNSFEPDDNPKINSFDLSSSGIEQVYAIGIIPVRFQEQEGKQRLVICGDARIEEEISCTEEVVICDNDICESGECSSCPQDCDYSECCGDGTCNNEETCGDEDVEPACNSDCGVCEGVCGDATCNIGDGECNWCFEDCNYEECCPDEVCNNEETCGDEDVEPACNSDCGVCAEGSCDGTWNPPEDLGVECDGTPSPDHCTNCVCDSGYVSDGNGECIEMIGECNNGETRECELTLGVCTGVQEVCENYYWPGCDYGEDYEESELSCDDDLDNDCDGFADDDDLMDCALRNYIAYFPFDGNVNDATGNYIGEFNGGSPTYVTGHDGQAINLDGSNDYVNLGNWDRRIAGENQPFTLMAWVEQRTPNGNQWIFGSQATWQHFIFGTLEDNLFFRWRPNGDPQQPGFNTGQSISDQGFKHVAVSYNADTDTVIIYIDGLPVLIENAPYGLDDADILEFYIGKGSSIVLFAEYFNGFVDEVKIYDRALSSLEIRILYSGENPPSFAGCDDFCIWIGYSNGVCRQSPAQCSVNGEAYESEGDALCILGGTTADTCCCIP